MNIAEQYSKRGKIYSRLHVGDKVVVTGKHLPHLVAAKEGDVLPVLEIRSCKEPVSACRFSHLFNNCPSDRIYIRSVNPETKATVALCLYELEQR